MLLPSIPFAILLHGAAVPAMAAPGDTFTPYGFASMTHDSNLLRLDNAIAGNAGTADTMRQAGAGMNVDWKAARQEILLGAAVNENRFDRYSVLNYTGRDLHGTWNWALDGHLSGDAGYANNLAIGSFADQQTLVRNLRTQERSFFDGRWALSTGWQIGAGVAKNKLSFPDSTQNTFDRVEDVGEASLQYSSTAQNKLGLKVRRTNGAYPNQSPDFVNLLDNGYQQSEVLASVDWTSRANNRLQGQVGTVERRHANFASRNYRDVNARGQIGWQATGHVRLDASAWREIVAYDDIISSYSRNRGVGLEPSWMPYSTITVSARLQRERRNFLGDPGLIAPAMTRQDTVLTRALALAYQPAPSYSFKVSMSDDRRDSNLPLLSYYSKMVSVDATFEM